MRRKGIIKSYLFAGLCVVVATGVRYLLRPLLGEELPLMLFVVAALAAAWFGGALPGTFALMLGLLVGDWLFVPPPGPHVERGALLEFCRYMVTAGFGIFLIEVLHRSRQRAEVATAKAREETIRCRRTEEDLREAHRQISGQAELLDRQVAERTEHLKATIESLQTVLYHIAHDLRAPVRAMHSFSSLLLEDHRAELSEEARSYALRIATSATRMDELTRDLLTFGKLAQMNVSLENVSLEVAIEGALAGLAEEIRTRRAEIRVDPDLPVVTGHKALIEEALVELISNAIRFTAPGVLPKVRIWAEDRDSVVRVWIEDNGIGIEPKFRERIFGVFQQLRQDERGTGMGLAIVKQAVERMRGHAGVESQPSFGSRFWIELNKPEEVALTSAQMGKRNGESAGRPLDSAHAHA